MTEREPSRPRVLRFWLRAFVLAMLLLSCERVLLGALYGPDGAWPEWRTLTEGLRFDAASVAYVLLPALLVATLLPHLRRGAATLAFAALALVCVVEIHFFAEFHRRLDFVVLEYLDDPATALGMAVETVGAGRIAIELLGAGAVVLFMRGRLPTADRESAGEHRSGASWFASAAVLCALFVAARGGLGRPLRPQDVRAGPDHLQRELALSGPFTLARHAFEALSGGGRLPDYGVPDDAAALARARSVFAPPGSRFVSDDAPAWRRPPARETPWRSVVMIVMESCAGRHVGALGASDSWTPRLDALSARGVLFTRFLSNGPSTNRGLPALLAGIPSFPLPSALTKSIEGRQPFITIGSVVADGGGATTFLTAGAASWENLGGWCGGQGFTTVVDGSDFDDEQALSVWGVPDRVLLDRVLAECDRMAADGSFCAVALTSSNHPPFAVPKAWGSAIADPRERAFRYADEALGTFLDAALARPWAANTVFVLSGDHGLHELARAEIDPERYHVPLLVIDGADVPRAPLEPRRVDRIASQVDVLPTLAVLLGGGRPHAAWGRDLFAANVPPGVAVMGPHGGAPLIAAADDDGRFVVAALPRGTPRAYHWDAAAGTLEPVDADAAAQDLATTARTYLATAHRAVLERRAGAPSGD